MLKVMLLFVLAFGFVACDEDDLAELVKGDPIPLTVGNYTSQCKAEDVGSSKESLEVENQTTIVVQESTYSDTDCMTLDDAGSPAAVTIALSDFSLAGTVAYMQIGGENEFKAYFIENNILYLSESKTEITEENVASSFSDFVKAPKDNAELVFTPVAF